MLLESFPASLVSEKNVKDLTKILLEKNDRFQALKKSDFGRRVVDLKEAQALLQRVAEITHEALELSEPHPALPELRLTHNLRKLPAMAARAYLVYIPMCILLLYLIISVAAAGFALFLTLMALFWVLATPYLVYRRTRLNIEHSGRYIRKAEGKGIIEIDQLPQVQFQSYLAHEYAHHLYYELGGQAEEAWLREGWARLAQWHVVNHLAASQGNPAFLYHALVQIIGELKFACTILSNILYIRIPHEVQRIRTIYHNNPFYRLFTGTPGYNVKSLTRHAVGTACCFLAQSRHGTEQALKEGLQATRCL
jgi:hypothetical protein